MFSDNPLVFGGVQVENPEFMLKRVIFDVESKFEVQLCCSALFREQRRTFLCGF